MLTLLYPALMIFGFVRALLATYEKLPLLVALGTAKKLPVAVEPGSFSGSYLRVLYAIAGFALLALLFVAAYAALTGQFRSTLWEFLRD